MHPMAPWTDVTFAGVYWRESERLPKLLDYVRPWFSNMVLGVQQSDDDTLNIAKEYADFVVEDKHHGHAEPTFNKVLRAIKTPWTFMISGDEWPSEDLLDSFQDMMNEWWKDQTIDAFWFSFHSTIDGHDFTAETDGHTRLFKTSLNWPTSMHSGPSPRHVLNWKTGYIRHDRSLDEMVKDYLGYLAIGKGNASWDTHNKMMIREACLGVASYRGIEYVKQHDWWSEVEPYIPEERITALQLKET